MSRRFLHQKPNPAKTDVLSQFVSGTYHNPAKDHKKKLSSKAYSSNRTKPRRKKR